MTEASRAPVPELARGGVGLLGPLERRLLLEVLDVRGQKLGSWTSALNWAAVVQAALRGKVLPLLAQRVLADALAVGDCQLARLRGALEETAVHNTRLLAELERVSSLLRAAGIECVALKGGALLARHYPHPAMRHTVDLDLLVDPERFPEAVTQLRGAGYADAPHTAALSFDGRSLAAALQAPHFHASTPLCGPSGVNLDLHHRVPASGFDASGGFRGWLERSSPVKPGGCARACHPRDLLVHLCEHFAVQNRADPRELPRLLCDLRVISGREPDWSSLVQGGAQRFAVVLARRLYEAAFLPERLPATLLPLLQRLAIADPALTEPLSALSEALVHAERFRRDLVVRPRYALSKLFPASTYMQQRYGIAPGSPGFLGRYAARLFFDPIRPQHRRPRRCAGSHANRRIRV